MIILFSFTALVILLYVAYPLWLACLKPVKENTAENHTFLSFHSYGHYIFKGCCGKPGQPWQHLDGQYRE